MDLKQNKMKAISTIILLAILFTSCLTQQKAVDYLSKKQLLPQVCADSFPVKADTVIREGQTIETVEVWTDTLYVTDTIDNTSLPDTIRQTKVITRWRTDTFNISKPDSARIKMLLVIIAGKDKEIAKLTADCDQWKVKAKNRSRNQWVSIIGNILLIALAGFILGKKLKKTV